MNSPLRFYRPSTDLQPFVGSYVFLDLPEGPPLEDLVYPGWTHLRIALSGKWELEHHDVVTMSDETRAVVQGPFSRALKVMTSPPTRVVSVSLTPLGLAAFTGKSAALFADRILPLTALLGEYADPLVRDLRAAASHEAMRHVLDTFFTTQASTPHATVPLLMQAHQLLVDPAIKNVEALARGLGRSPRQTARISLDVFGFLPKLLLRRQRFMRTMMIIRANRDRPWAELIDGDYYDHSHFLRDFRRFMDMTPTQYHARPTALIDPVLSERLEQLGHPHQSLDPLTPRAP
jgi:AraC-like DNA-binding protein